MTAPDSKRLVADALAALEDLGVTYPVDLGHEDEWRSAHGDAVTNFVLTLQDFAEPQMEQWRPE